MARKNVARVENMAVDAMKELERLKKENASLKNANDQLGKTIHNQTLLIGEQTMTIRQLAEQLRTSGGMKTVPNVSTKNG